MDNDEEVARYVGEVTYENLTTPLKGEKQDEEDH